MLREIKRLGSEGKWQIFQYKVINIHKFVLILFLILQQFYAIWQAVSLMLLMMLMFVNDVILLKFFNENFLLSLIWFISAVEYNSI